MGDLKAFDHLREILASREMPEYQQIVSAHPDVFDPEEIDWLRAHDVHIEFAWFVPRDSVWITRCERKTT